MVGDAQDMTARLRALLPTRWFGDTSPVLAGVLAGTAQMASGTYAQVQYAKAQTRIATASGLWLNLVAQDFFGTRVARALGETDAVFRARVTAAMFPQRATRGAVIVAVQALGAGALTVFEPSRPADTRAWNVALGYGVAGGWGSLAMPFQALATLPASAAAGPSLAAMSGVLPSATTVWTRPAGPTLTL